MIRKPLIKNSIMKIHDNRFNGVLSVRYKRKKLRASAKVLTPARLTGVQEMILWPTAYVTLGFSVLLGATWPLQHYEVLPFYEALGKSPLMLAGGILSTSYLWVCEITGGYNASRLVFGRRVRITVSETHVSIGRKHKIPRQHRIAFVPERLDGISPIYANSARVIVVVDDAITIPLVEVFDPRSAMNLAGALNAVVSEFGTTPPGQTVGR